MKAVDQNPPIFTLISGLYLAGLYLAGLSPATTATPTASVRRLGSSTAGVGLHTIVGVVRLGIRETGGSRFGIQDSGFRTGASKFAIRDSGSRIHGVGFDVELGHLRKRGELVSSSLVRSSSLFRAEIRLGFSFGLEYRSRRSGCALRESALAPALAYSRRRWDWRRDQPRPIEPHSRILRLDGPLHLFVERRTADFDPRRRAKPVQDAGRASTGPAWRRPIFPRLHEGVVLVAASVAREPQERGRFHFFPVLLARFSLSFFPGPSSFCLISFP